MLPCNILRNCYFPKVIVASHDLRRVVSQLIATKRPANHSKEYIKLTNHFKTKEKRTVTENPRDPDVPAPEKDLNIDAFLFFVPPRHFESANRW